MQVRCPRPSLTAVLIVFLLAAIAAICLTGCTTSRYATVNETRPDGTTHKSRTVSHINLYGEKIEDAVQGLADGPLGDGLLAVLGLLGGGGVVGGGLASVLASLRGKRKTAREDGLWDEATQLAERKALIGALLARTAPEAPSDKGVQ